MSNLTNIFRWVWNHLVFIGCPVVGLPLWILCFFQNVPKFEEVGSRHVWFWDRTRESSRHGGIFGTEGRRKRVRPRKILVGFTVSPGNLNLNPLWRDGFFGNHVQMFHEFSYVLDRNFLGTSRNQHAVPWSEVPCRSSSTGWKPRFISITRWRKSRGGFYGVLLESSTPLPTITLRK